MSERTHTLEEIRRSYEPKRWEELSGELPAVLIFRPVSFWVTPWFLKLGWSAGAVSALSAAIALALPFVALGGDAAYLAVAALGFVYQVLACVDGNVARSTGTTSQFGQLTDLVVGQSYYVLLFIAIGLLVEGTGGGVLGDHALEFALVLPSLVLLNRLTRNYSQLHFAKRQMMDDEPRGPLSPGRLVLIALAGLENLYIVAVAVGGAFGVLDWVLVGIGVYVVGVFAYVELEQFAELWNR